MKNKCSSQHLSLLAKTDTFIGGGRIFNVSEMARELSYRVNF